jgi:putative hydrolase of the HAD superfamily
MQSPVRGVIFDRDGVLTRFDYAATLELFRDVPEFQFDDAFTRWERWYRAAEPARDEEAERRVLTGFFAHLSVEWRLPPEVRDRLMAFDYLTIIQPYPDARRALDTAKKRGLRVGVLSNFPLASLAASLRKAGFEGLFDAAASAPVIGAAKPDRRAYEHMLDALGVLPHECLLIDDEAPCVEGARAIGVRAYLLDRKGKGAGGALPDLDAFIPHLEGTAMEEVS